MCKDIWNVDCFVCGKSTKSIKQVQLWYNWFKEGREDVNDDVRPGRLSTLTADENIEAVKKMILDNRRITIRETSCWWCWHIVWLMSSNFYGCFRHKTCSSESGFKIIKLWTKTTSHGHRSGDVDDVQRP